MRNRIGIYTYTETENEDEKLKKLSYGHMTYIMYKFAQ
jgi:hypothetical protein